MVKEIRYYNEAQRIKFEEDMIKDLVLEYYHEQKLAGNEVLSFKIVTEYNKQNNYNSVFQYLHERIELIPVKTIKYTCEDKNAVERKENVFKKVINKIIKKEGK